MHLPSTETEDTLKSGLGHQRRLHAGVDVLPCRAVRQRLLCRPLEGSLRSKRGYYVVLPPRKRRGALIERFVDWLEQERL